jgi:Rrf2 family nitric oxide-sensitive transcriptional repressor
MYLAAAEQGAWIRTADVARAFGISLNHLQKAAQGLARAGYIQALQGRSGGVRLAHEPATMRFKGALDRAERVFIAELDRYTLADVVIGRTGVALLGLIASQG